MKELIRNPHVAGRFYPDTAAEIEKMFERLVQREKKMIQYELSDRQIIGAVLPHAGIMYSGYQAIHFFEIMLHADQKFDTFIILHPIHRGGHISYASDECKGWKTPLGEVSLDSEFIDAMGVMRSAYMHESEHSAEVILPFIQKYNKHSFRIVPIGIAKQKPEVAEEIAHRLSTAVDKTGRKVCILASCDFSHYVNPEEGMKLDNMVTDKILKLDSQGVFKEITNHNISVCGYGPVMALIDFSAMNYADIKAEVIARGHSGEVSPSEQVVDYISILFFTK